MLDNLSLDDIVDESDSADENEGARVPSKRKGTAQGGPPAKARGRPRKIDMEAEEEEARRREERRTTKRNMILAAADKNIGQSLKRASVSRGKRPQSRYDSDDGFLDLGEGAESDDESADETSGQRPPLLKTPRVPQGEEATLAPTGVKDSSGFTIRDRRCR